jgi:hemolysin activation/secretion protein
MLAQGKAQFSLANLIPAEQYALGGFNTIRGYAEKVVNGDNAVCANFEIKTPEMAVLGIWFPRFGDSLTVLGFMDAGYAWYREAIDTAPAAQALFGYGPGIRYNISSYFTSRLDVGFPALRVGKFEKNADGQKTLVDITGGPHVHFSANLSY